MTMLSLVSLQKILRAKKEFWPSLADSRPYDPVGGAQSFAAQVLPTKFSRARQFGPAAILLFVDASFSV